MRPVLLTPAMIMATTLAAIAHCRAAEATAAGPPIYQATPLPAAASKQVHLEQITGNASKPVELQFMLVQVSLGKLRAAGISFGKPAAKDAKAPSSAADRLFKNAEGPNWTAVDENSPLLKTLEDLLAKGYATTLANPTLTAVSGRPVNLSWGGEIPVLVPQSMGTVSIEWKKYGTSFDFVPIIADDMLRMEVRIRLSEPDSSTGVALNDTKIPGMRVLWDMETGTKSKLGQTLVLFGPSQDSIPIPESVPADADQEKSQKPQRKAEKTHEEMQILILIRPKLVQ